MEVNEVNYGRGVEVQGEGREISRGEGKN